MFETWLSDRDAFSLRQLLASPLVNPNSLDAATG
jgi:hypothetical protein